VFYPPRLPAGDWLPHYARTFDTVEANGTFYKLPERETFERWRTLTPPGFTLTIKASRYLTHLKRLIDPAAPLERMFQRALALGPRLGPVLYQLPPRFNCNLDRLTTFFEALPRRAADVPTGDEEPKRPRTPPLRHAIEFRDPSWYAPGVFALLARHRVALCLHDKTGSEWLGDPVGPFVYLRFHGTSGHYSGSYPDAALAEWAARLRGWRAAGLDVYAYFNNDVGGAAVKNAQTLIRLTTDD
jgi:uncharacterized protein YecE (DUF72 family)